MNFFGAKKKSVLFLSDVFQNLSFSEVDMKIIKMAIKEFVFLACGAIIIDSLTWLLSKSDKHTKTHSSKRKG
jgi:hypothetical protein